MSGKTETDEADERRAGNLLNLLALYDDVYAEPSQYQGDVRLTMAALRAVRSERDAELARYKAVVDAAIRWQSNHQYCDFCERDTLHGRQHDAGCPLVTGGFIAKTG